MHPVVFQVYKSTFVFLAGFLFLIPRAIRVKGDDDSSDSVPIFVFTYWGIVSAMGWIPSGLTTIVAVPVIGMGLAVATAAGSSAVLSFLVFWLVMGEPIQKHSCGHECSYYLAPLWLALTVAGMVAMVFCPRVKGLPKWLAGGSQEEEGDDISIVEGIAGDEHSGYEEEPLLFINQRREEMGGHINDNNRDQEQWVAATPFSFPWSVGVVAAFMTGVFSAAQYGAVTAGKQYEMGRAHCLHNATKCPANLIEQFDSLGSWMVSFGIGSMLVTLLVLLCLFLWRLGCRLIIPDTEEGRLPLLPPFHFYIMLKPGSIAGSFWVLGNMFTVLAVVTGGNAISTPQVVSSQLITSGLWGIFYYREIRKGNAVLWASCAIFTLVMMVLLGFEKA